MISTRKNVHGNGSHAINLIVLIEDDMDHAELIIRIINAHPIPNQVLHFPDGQSALDYLFRRNSFSDSALSPRPRVILLDLNLPRTDGIDILRIIKESDELKMIPVILLTTSTTERDLTRAYCNHANSYLVKPVGWEELKELMHNLCFYWLGHNMSPKIQEATSQNHKAVQSLARIEEFAIQEQWRVSIGHQSLANFKEIQACGINFECTTKYEAFTRCVKTDLSWRFRNSTGRRSNHHHRENMKP